MFEVRTLTVDLSPNSTLDIRLTPSTSLNVELLTPEQALSVGISPAIIKGEKGDAGEIGPIGP